MSNLLKNFDELDAIVALRNKEWSHYFHFLIGTKFKIDGPGLYDGNGRVLENSLGQLTLRIDLKDSLGVFPEKHGVIAVTYLKEGSGNKAEMTEDGKIPQKDDNAEIASNEEMFKRGITIKSGENTIVIVVRRLPRDEISLTLKVDSTPTLEFRLRR